MDQILIYVYVSDPVDIAANDELAEFVVLRIQAVVDSTRIVEVRYCSV